MKRLMQAWVLMPWVAMAQGTTAPEKTTPTEMEAARVEDRQRNFGAMLAPAVLPDGGSAVAGWVGAPEVGVSYRQGLSGWELGARARFDYLHLSTTVEAVGRWPVWSEGAWAVAPELGLGVTANPGSRYFDAQNLRGWFLRVDPALVATWRVVETVAALGTVEVPYDLGLSPGGTWRVKPLAGVGAEIYLGEDLTLSLLGQLGVDVFKEVRGVTQSRLGYGARLGLGVRLF
jgi:hypothetical protein